MWRIRHDLLRVGGLYFQQIHNICLYFICTSELTVVSQGTLSNIPITLFCACGLHKRFIRLLKS